MMDVLDWLLVLAVALGLTFAFCRRARLLSLAVAGLWAAALIVTQGVLAPFDWLDAPALPPVPALLLAALLCVALSACCASLGWRLLRPRRLFSAH
ncbi:hypothetical protein [Burkholderia gladioli]|uniref:hypothetical protein n=1 Tax=Burkholderia gladioli TaxID=28095 RepID=UPI001640D439|nr:hypothetical protein [Burkholderia gladioli]